MLNEEISKESLDTGKRAAETVIRKAVQISEKEFREMLEQMQTDPNKVQEKLSKHGKQMSVQEILQKDAGAKTIDISDLGMGDFKPIARRYGLDFAVVKSRYLDPPKYTVFFQAKDQDTINRVMEEYTAKCMGKTQGRGKTKTKERPSLLAKLRKLKEQVAAIPRKAAERRKEEAR